MAIRTGQCYYKILQRFIRDSNHGRFQPMFAVILKKYGLTIPTVGKMLIYYLCKENNVDGALGFITEVTKNKLKVNFQVDVIRRLTEHGRFLDAYKLVMGAKNNIPTMDVVDYSVIIDGLCKEGCIDKALDLCNFATKRGVVLNVLTYNSFFNGLCRQGCLVEAFRLFDSLERDNIIPSDMTYGTLIDGLVREGFLMDARQLFERMVIKGLKPNTHIYNSLIIGYSKARNLDEALKLLRDLESRYLEPDKFTVSAVIYGFSSEGDMEGALHFFVDMKKNGIPPDFLGFLYLIRGLCAKGRMEEARTIMREMLQDESVVELINRVDVEIDNESIESMLLHLCEQGSIHGSLVILNEIGSMFFPYKRSVTLSGQKPTGSLEEEPSTVPLNTLHSTDEMNFNAFYSQVASLCELGDLPGANALAKNMISRFVRNS